jgi:hypothetical protein
MKKPVHGWDKRLQDTGFGVQGLAKMENQQQKLGVISRSGINDIRIPVHGSRVEQVTREMGKKIVTSDGHVGDKMIGLAAELENRETAADKKGHLKG